jgi:hypothetical protein
MGMGVGGRPLSRNHVNTPEPRKPRPRPHAFFLALLLSLSCSDTSVDAAATLRGAIAGRGLGLRAESL